MLNIVIRFLKKAIPFIKLKLEHTMEWRKMR